MRILCFLVGLGALATLLALGCYGQQVSAEGNHVGLLLPALMVATQWVAILCLGAAVSVSGGNSTKTNEPKR